MQVDLAVEVGRHFDLAVGRDRGSDPPRKPALLAPRCDLERRDQREGITCSVCPPDDHRRGGARLQSSKGCTGSVELPLSQRAEPDPSRQHAADYSIIAACSSLRSSTTSYRKASASAKSPAYASGSVTPNMISRRTGASRC